MKTTKTRNYLRWLAALALCAVSLAQGGTASVSAQRGGVDRRLLAAAERYSGDRFTVETSTPQGARVVGVRRPSGEELRAIDRGLSELFAVARRRGYRAALN
ncbi:MAG TPA: hypothetical protein VF064_03190, partial [Pyrinomonadaceae bacterium]